MLWGTLLATSLPLLAAPRAVQDPGRQALGPPVVALDQLQVRRYTIRDPFPEEFAHLAEQVVGRVFYVVERGGVQSRPVPNLQWIGSDLVLVDTPEYLDRMVAVLLELDAVQRGAPDGGEALETVPYTPRYASLGTLAQALEPFYRSENGVENINMIGSEGVLVLRDTPAAVAEMLALVRRMDVPAPQVLLTCHLLRPNRETGDPVPADVREALRRLVPQYELESIGFALLQTSVTPGRSVMLRLAGGVDGSYELKLRVEAFDAETSTLTVEDCSLREYVQAGGAGGPGGAGQVRDVFSTNVVLRGDEHTVVGASGSAPVFLVLRPTPL